MFGGAEAARLVISLAVTNGPAMKALGDIQGKMAEIGRGAQSALGAPVQKAFDAFGSIGDAADGMRSVANAVEAVAGSMIGGAAKMETYALQFEVLLGSASAAQARMEDLSDYANKTPFQLPGVVEASRLLQTFTGGALAAGEGLRMVGDIAAGTGKPIEDVAFKVGRMYDAFRSGTNIGESLMYLQEMGAITGDTRREIEGLAEQVKSGGMTMETAWAKATEGFGRFSGMTDKLAASTEGKMSTAIDAVNMGLAKLGESFLPMVKQALDLVVVGMDFFNGVMEKAKKYFFVLVPFISAAAKAFFVYARNAWVATGATGGLAAAMKALPIIGWIAIAISALEAFAMVWENDFLGIRTIVEKTVKWLGDNFGWIGTIIGGLAAVVGTLVGSIQSSFTDLTPTMDVATQTWTKYTAEQQKAIDNMAASRASMRNIYGGMATDAATGGAAIISAVGRPAVYIRDTWAADEVAARDASAATMAGIVESVAAGGRKLVADSRGVTATLVAEILSRNKALADAASGAMTTATAERFAVGAKAAARKDLADNKAIVTAGIAEIAALKIGGIKKDEATRIAAIKQEIADAKLARPGLLLAYDQRIADLTQYGSDAKRLSRLTGAAAAKSLQEGLTSGNEATRRSTIESLGAIYLEMGKLKQETYRYGLATMSEYGRGLREGGAIVINGVRTVVADVGLYLHAESPPTDPRNPLSKIGVWGRATGEAWGTGLSAGMKFTTDNVTKVLDILKQRFANFQSFLSTWPKFTASAITAALNRTLSELAKVWATISKGEQYSEISAAGDEKIRAKEQAKQPAEVQAIYKEIDDYTRQINNLVKRMSLPTTSAAQRAILLNQAAELDMLRKEHIAEAEALIAEFQKQADDAAALLQQQADDAAALAQQITDLQTEIAVQTKAAADAAAGIEPLTAIETLQALLAKLQADYLALTGGLPGATTEPPGTVPPIPGRPGTTVVAAAGVPAAVCNTTEINATINVTGPTLDPYGTFAQDLAAALIPGLQRELRRQGITLA